MPRRRANVKNEKQYEALKDKGMSKERAARIANSPDASKKGSTRSSSKQGGNTAQKRAAGRKRWETHRPQGILVTSVITRNDLPDV